MFNCFILPPLEGALKLLFPGPPQLSHPVADQGGVGASLKGLMEARQGGRAKAGAKHWWEWVQGPKTKTSTGAWLLLRLMLQRGKRH